VRFSSSLARYLAREVLLHALLGLAILCAVFVARNLLRYGAELLRGGASAGELAALVRGVALASLAYTLPLAFLFGVLAGVARLAADGEALGLRACGLGLAQLALPLLALGLAVSALDALLLLELEPRAKRELRAALAARAAAGAGLEAGRWVEIGSRSFWAEEGAGGRFERVVLADRSRPGRALFAFAERAELAEGASAPRLRLLRGDLHVEGEGAPARIAFEALELPLPRAGLAAERWRVRPKDLTAAELRERLAAGGGAAAALYRVQLERRLALAAAPLLLGLAALPLAGRCRRAARAFGFLACAALSACYYALLSLGEQLALGGLLPARAALQAPNAALALGALLLLARSRR
jgi:lipopolysaccharide export LptBFGC system permease protein LptF